MNVLLAAALLVGIAASGCSDLLASGGNCGDVDRIDHHPSRPFTEEAAVVPDGFEWSVASTSACSKQHVGATNTVVVGMPGAGCSAVTGITGKIFPSTSFPYSFGAATASATSDAVTWTARASDAGLSQGADEATAVTYDVTLRVLYPMTSNPVADAACLDAMLQDVHIQSTYKSYQSSS